MNKRQSTYALLISIAGAIVLYFSFQVAAPYLLEGGASSVVRVFAMTLLLGLLRSIPGTFGVHRVHVSFCAALAVALVFDATVAIVAYATSALLSSYRVPESGKRRSVLTGSLRELLFGESIVAIAITLGATLYRSPSQIGAAFVWPDSLWPACSFIGASVGIAWLLFALLSLLGEEHSWRSVGGSFLLAVPQALATVFLAILLTLLQAQPGGEIVAVMTVLALVLMRYAYMLHSRERKQYRRIIDTLSEAIEAKDPTAQGHAKRVELCCVLVGRAMRLSGKRIEGLRIASQLHDVGKIGIDDTVLRKDGDLDEKEWEYIRKHPQIGHKIIEQVELPLYIRNTILHHHERYDGTGYPQGIKLADLPIEDSILSAADAFVAMISDRPYRPGMSVEKALVVLRAESGKQFHPDVVHAFDKNATRLQNI